MRDLVVWFGEVSKEDSHLVGGKGANLGEMVRAGIPVPPGFIITAKAYDLFLTESGLGKEIKKEIDCLDVHETEKLHQIAKSIQNMILQVPVPKAVKDQILAAYQEFDRGKAYVAVRSSATAEDLPEASFAGQQATFLNVQGQAALIDTVRKCWASLFTARAIFYRAEKGFDQLAVKIAVPVQRMIQADSSGVMFTIDPVSEDKSLIVIEAIWGLGELIVQGSVTPDTYWVKKKSLEIAEERIGRQKVQLVKKGKKTKEIPVAKRWQEAPKLTRPQIKKLAKLGMALEKHYYFPQDIEWALEGSEVYIVQTRPVTTMGRSQTAARFKDKREPLISGTAASPGRASGLVRIIAGPKELAKVKKGDVLVAKTTTPDYVPGMKRAVAIVTDHGGKTSHAAIVSRELGIPAVVGTGEATKKLKNEQTITVDGSTGKIYLGGLLQGEKKIIPQPRTVLVKHARKEPVDTATKIYVNLAEPEIADEVAALPVDGVGLLRAEFMVAQMGVHPRHLLKQKKGGQFTTKLQEGIAQICDAFYPRPVIYRATDFKTNEFRGLKGGEAFEPEEENPFLGYRGVLRYLADPQVFQLEVEAVKKVRRAGLTNLYLMIPFVRTVAELKAVKKRLSKLGLSRKGSFQLWMMVELPSNVILLESFLEVGVDGVSIGSNDLTMLILGADRDNEHLAGEFDERDPAVLWALQKVVETCKQKGVTSSICGQAPSSYPDLVTQLVNWGISSVSVNRDAVERTREVVFLAEKNLSRKR